MWNIRYIKRADLDADKWNNCIDEAPNGLIYAYTFYLDTMCDNWDALVLNDYEAVMPLPWRKKWGIPYLYQPPFIQRLGLFGNGVIRTFENLFYDLLLQKFKFIHYNVSTLPQIKKVTYVKRKNLIIDLSVDYETIKTKYSKEAVKNVRKAQNRGCQFEANIKVDDVIDNFKMVYGALNNRLNEQHYLKFKTMAEKALKAEKAIVAGIRDANENLIFSAVVLKDHKRLYYILGAPTQLGREKRAPYFFIDHLLKSYAGQHLIFDFEGSDIPNVTYFYQQFTQTIEYYYEVKINRLPLPIRWLKS